MSVISSIEDSGPCRKTVKIDVPAPAVEAETGRILAQYQKQVRIPGFRKGKAPREMVGKRFAEDIQKELEERLVPRYWSQAVAEAELEPLVSPHLDQVDHQKGALSFVATVEVRPQFNIGSLEGLNLPEADVEPTEDEVVEALTNLQRDVADWVPVDRGAARGDLVTFEIVEASEESQPELQVMSVEIGDQQVWEELTLALTGAAADHKGTFERVEGEGEARRVRTFRYRVTAVKERELPEVDDALASKVGEFQTLDELRTDIRGRLRAVKSAELGRRREEAVLDQLRSDHPATLPAGVVNHEIEHMLSDYAQNLSRQGVDLGQTEIDWRKLAEEVRQPAEQRVHARLLLDAVAQKDKIELEEVELESALASIARVQGQSIDGVRRSLEENGRMADLRARLLRDKAMRRLLGEPEAARDDPSDGTAVAVQP